MQEIELLARESIRRLKPYSSARSEFSGGAAKVFMDANENNLNPYQKEQLYRYPDSSNRELREAYGKFAGLSSECVFVGNGSDEGIDLLVRIFCEPRVDKILIFPPTYGMYKVQAEIQGVEVVAQTMGNGFSLRMPEAGTCVDVKLAFLCSPNNPSGSAIAREEIEELLARVPGLVVVDEAYVDFCPEKSCVPLLSGNPRLVILRTLSKAWGLAGIRFGAVLAAPGVIALLQKIKPPYNVNRLTAQLALETLSHPERMREMAELLVSERKKLGQALSRFKFARKVYPSDANFLLVRVDNARTVYEKLLAAGIVVRDRSSQEACEDCLRISVGTPEQNKMLLNALSNIEGIGL